MSKEQSNSGVSTEIEIDDDALELAAGGGGGGQMDNATEIVYASTFIPFDSSF